MNWLVILKNNILQIIIISRLKYILAILTKTKSIYIIKIWKL
jgi:hypothetical protein